MARSQVGSSTLLSSPRDTAIIFFGNCQSQMRSSDFIVFLLYRYVPLLALAFIAGGVAACGGLDDAGDEEVLALYSEVVVDWQELPFARE